jgi:hypothetical protein
MVGGYMRLITRLYSVTSLRMPELTPYPSMSPRNIQGQHHLHLLQYYYIRIIKKHTNMRTHMKPVKVKPTDDDDGQFVGCVNLASSMKSSIIHLICRWKPELQYSSNGIICCIILWYNMEIHQCNLP